MKLETEEDANAWLNAAKALAVVSAWSATGLFQRLQAGPVRRTDLPADARAVDATLPVLRHIGVVSTEGDTIALTPRGVRLLQEGGMPTERNLVALRDLTRLPEVLREGGPVKDDQGRSKGTRGGTVTGDPAQTERFLDMLYRMSDAPARATLQWLAPGLPAKASVLDLGGGHGRYARAFADAGHDVTIFDQPLVVELAKKRHGDAIRYVAGDFHEAQSFGGPYDLILLCNIVHAESKAANASLIARAAKSLKPGGRVAVRDMLLDEHEQNPASSVFFGIIMLLYTDDGRSPTVRDVEGWLAAAGLREFRLIVQETHQIAVARKA
jgi:2-polyprenyl-3-methyl-5-hydroxy-6-metoxy-1,4-benzoquinol methylase